MNIKVIDNFLNQKDFKELCSLNLQPVNKESIKVYHNKIFKDGKIEVECISEENIKELFKNYHEKAIKLLQELNPKKVELYEYSEFHIIETGSDYKFPIHDDIPNKLLSGVIYLKPERNTGTILYEDKKGNGKKTIEWKQNRALFFSRSEMETWHSYEGDRKQNRYALIYNLMTDNIKGVYKAENKNYYLGLLRYKINPVLFRFFKFTI